MNAASAVVLAIVLLFAALAVLRCRRKGAPCSCGCGCGCSGKCGHAAENMVK